jgi:hypothetical protein
MQSDRFAREIIAILARSNAARSRRLMRNPLGAWGNAISTLSRWLFSAL